MEQNPKQPASPSPSSTTPQAPQRPIAVAFPSQQVTIINGKTVNAPKVAEPATNPTGGFYGDTSSTGKKPFLRRLKGKALPIAILAAIVLLGGSAAAFFGYYVPNKPENLWAKSMSNMGKGYDKLSSYAQNYSVSKGSKTTGSFSLTGDISASGNIETNSDGTNSELKANVSAGAVKADLDAISIVSSARYPDIYIKVSGLNTLGSLLNALNPQMSQTINSVNGQWYSIDHSLYEKYAGSTSQINFSKADIMEVVNAAAAPTKKYVFTDDQSKMAFVIKDTVGKEKQDGRNVYHYKIGVNKANLKAYNTELCEAVSKTKIYKSFSSSVGSTQALNDCKDTADIDNIKDSGSADVWVDTRTKLVHKIRFAEPGNTSNYFDVFQDYQGGNVIPFGLAISQKNGSNTFSANINVGLNMSNNNIDLKANFKNAGDSKILGTVSLKYAPSNTSVKIEKPSSAKDINGLLNSLGLGDLFNSFDTSSQSHASVQDKAKDTERKTDISALQGQIEAFFAQQGYYPSLAQLNSASFRNTYMKGLALEALKDPSGSATKLVAAPTANVYSYQTTPAGCDNVKIKCTGYTLTATLDTGGTYAKQSLN